MDKKDSHIVAGIKRGYRNLRKNIYNYVIHPLVGSINSPHYDALGVSLGLIVGLGAPLGSHMLLLGALRLLFKFNVMVAFGFTFVVNPLNAIPLYYGYYMLGSFLTGESASLSFENFTSAMSPVMESAYFWETMLTFFHLGEMIVRRWIVAAIFLGVLFGVSGYVATYLIQRNRLRKSLMKLSLEYRKLATKSGHSNLSNDTSPDTSESK
jgi:uncharacterized protein